KITTIVDKSRIHTHKINYCRCTNAPTADIQLCQIGLFPASFTQPKTAFTFDVLNNFLLDNLKCGASAMNYYHKLRRMTTSVFPHLVLLGINVTLPPEDKQEEINSESELPNPSWLYSRSLVMDGNFNFKAEYLYAANPMDKVSLMDGYSFMVSNTTYKAYHTQAKDVVEQSECNNYQAINQENASQYRLEATNISSCACARHGCFVPHAMVDS
ncbi:hypothetical protein BDR04DRAFT_1040236, partial [Suillus decipiens]